MLNVITISQDKLENVLRKTNLWWSQLPGLPDRFSTEWRRAFLPEFLELVKSETPRREVVLLGPRRVGKTFLIHHAIKELLDSGVPASQILYVAIDNPVFIDCALDDLLTLYEGVTGVDWRTTRCFIFFDEIQYLTHWEQHLKALHDQGGASRFVVSGSAAGALSQGSRESGAGRFTDFLLPPLTFAEFLGLRKEEGLVERDEDGFFAPDHTTRGKLDRYK